MVKFCRKMKQNRSFADFTMGELCNFMKEFEVWALEKGWQDVFLDDGEKRSLLNFKE